MQLNLRDFIVKWNNDYPIDYWYRNKHGIRFNSPEHRACSFIDMYIEFIEEREINKYLLESKEKFDYVPDSGNFMKKVKEKEIDTEEVEQLAKEEEERLQDLFKSDNFDTIDKMFGNG
jgi:hypothetical protein